MVGPKPNGKLWPTLVKFSTSRIEVWIEQTGSGVVRLERCHPIPKSLSGEEIAQIGD